MSFFRKILHPYPILLFIIICVSTLFLAHLIKSSCFLRNDWCGQDMDQYMDYSTNMLNGHGFTASKVSNMYYVSPAEHIYIPEILRVPAFPVVLTLGRIFYNNALFALFLNILCFIGILFYSYFLMKEFLSKWFALVGLGFLALMPTMLFYVGFLGDVDVFVCFVMTGFIYHVYKIFNQKANIPNTIVAIFFGVVTVMSRQNTMIMVLSILVFFIGYTIFLKEKIALRLYVSILFFVFLCIFLWSTRNFLITGKFTFSAASGEQLFVEHAYFTPFPTKDSTRLVTSIMTNHYGDTYMKTMRDKGVSIPRAYVAIDDYLRKASWHYIFSHPFVTMQQFISELIAIYTGRTFSWVLKDKFSYLLTPEIYIGWFLLFASLVFPITILFKKTDACVRVFFLWTSTMFFLWTSAFFHGVVIGNRGMLPVLPAVILLSFCSVQAIFAKIKKVII